MKHWLYWLRCKLNLHPKRLYTPLHGNSSGLYNLFSIHYRVDFYQCKHCKREIHWSVKTNY